MHFKTFASCVAVAAASAAVGTPAFAESNDQKQRDELSEKYAAGIVIFGPETTDPATATAGLTLKIKDAIEQVSKRQGVPLVAGDFKISFYAINHWRVVKAFGKRYKIPLPNTFRGYLAWAP